MKKVYICGPITGIPGGNYTLFEDVQQALQAAGYKVVNPHLICMHLDQKTTHHRTFMGVCLKALATCDIVATLPGFETSKGCKMELDFARNYPDVMEVVPAFKLVNLKMAL
jgi:nucleoside 2-deoxyribosyltransferase